jgi:hypothetical protein
MTQARSMRNMRLKRYWILALSGNQGNGNSIGSSGKDGDPSIINGLKRIICPTRGKKLSSSNRETLSKLLLPPPFRFGKDTSGRLICIHLAQLVPPQSTIAFLLPLPLPRPLPLPFDLHYVAELRVSPIHLAFKNESEIGCCCLDVVAWMLLLGCCCLDVVAWMLLA